MNPVTAFAPATVSNVACGFDVLGFALDSPGDEVTARFIDGPAGVSHRRHRGRRRPAAARRGEEHGGRRRAGPADRARRAPRRALSIRKGLPLSSGLGGSAASAVAAVVAVDALLGANTSIETLLTCAFEGERLGAGSAHADNIAPCLYGGFVLVRRANPPDIIRLPVPRGLVAVVVHPDLEIETAKARALLGDDGSARGCHSAMGESWRVRRRPAPRRFRADRAIARRHDRRAAARPARARVWPYQARGDRRRRARMQPVRIGAVAVRACVEATTWPARRRRDDRGRQDAHRRRAADLRVADRRRRARASVQLTCAFMTFVTTRVRRRARFLHDGAVRRARARRRTVRPGDDRAVGRPTSSRGCRTARSPRSPARAAAVHARRARRDHARSGRRRGAQLSDPARRSRAGHLRARALSRSDAGVQGRRRARDGAADGVAARGDEPLTVLAATSGDTGSAVAHAFHRVPHTRVVVLYPEGRVSPTQEAQLTMFNGRWTQRAGVCRRRQLRRLPSA